MEIHSIFIGQAAYKKPTKKVIIVLSGVPASGKSTVGENFAEIYKSNGKNCVIVSSDAIRYEMYQSYDNFAGDKAVWVEFYKRINEVKEGYVIADATFLTNKARKAMFDNTTADQYVLVHVEADEEEIFERNRSRSRHVPDHAIRRMMAMDRRGTEEDLAQFDGILNLINHND